MPINAVKWARMTATSSSSLFASSPSLLSCCSFGKLIRLSNAFSFSLRLYSLLFALLALLLTSNRKFLASGCSLCVPRHFLAVLDDRYDQVLQGRTRYAEAFSATTDPQPPLSRR